MFFVKNKYQQKKRRGFTLIELIVGLAIFAVIALTLYSTFAQGINLNRRARHADNMCREIRWALETIALDLENMVEYQYVDATTGEARGSFTGDETSLSFILPTDSGLKKIRYYLKSPEDVEVHQVIVNRTARNKGTITTRYEETAQRTRLLVREEIPLFDLTQSTDDDEEGIEILSQYVQEGKWHLFYAHGSDGGGEDTIDWQGQWGAASNPRGVRIEVAFVDPENNQESITIQRDVMIPTGSWGE